MLFSFEKGISKNAEISGHELQQRTKEMKNHKKETLSASVDFEQLNKKELLTRYETAAYLGVCLTVLDRSGIPCIKVGRNVRYRKTVLESWILEHEDSGNANGGER